MEFVGGYDVQLEGMPSPAIAKCAEPDVLHVPLFSRSFNFSALRVENGEEVKPGQVLAEDPNNYSVPLLAPVGGTVNLEAVEYHVTLEGLSGSFEEAVDKAEVGDEKRQALLRLGVWAFIRHIGNGRVPDPTAAPEHLIIPISRFEPFFPNPEVFLKDRLEQFGNGLALLHEALLGTQIILVVSEGASGVMGDVASIATQNSNWAQLVTVPPKYPFESPALVAQQLGLDLDTAWTMDPQAVLGAERALNESRANVVRLVSVSGPALADPSHYQVVVGHPLAALVAPPEEQIYLRIIDGGVLTGKAIGGGQKGLDGECLSLTVLQENTERAVMSYVQPGYGKQSYSKTFASIFAPLFKEKLTTALRGEARPCVFCGYCVDVCPAGIIPHLIYRYLDNDRPEDAYRVGLDKCVECGLCSYVCLSKIEHLDLFQAEKIKYASESEEG